MNRISVWVLMVLMALFLAACGDDSVGDDDTDNDSSNDVLSGSTLSTFYDDVRACTPFLSGGTSYSGNSALNAWTGWDTDNSNGVLGKIFNPVLGEDESIYAQIQILDEHIALVNEFTEFFDDEGSHTVGDKTATVETTVTQVEVPYLSWMFDEPMNVPVDRIVTVQSGDLTVHMAFDLDGSREVIVEQYTEGTTVSGVYYTVQDGNYRAVWHASVRDSKVQFTWDGDIGEYTFRLTENTDAGTNWQAMGGGGVEAQSSQMAFMARNDSTNNSAIEYYITLSLAELVAGTAQTPVSAASVPPSGAGVLSYITDDDSDCPGFYPTGEYPSGVSDLEWNN